MTINRKLERKKEEVTDMMYEDVAKDIQRVIEEQIELEMVELRGNGEPQFKVTMIDGEELPEDVVMMVNLKKKSLLIVKFIVTLYLQSIIH